MLSLTTVEPLVYLQCDYSRTSCLCSAWLQ